MAHLTAVLSRLPRLELSLDWSHRWLLDLPLQAILSRSAGYPEFPLRYLLSDILNWIPKRQCFLLRAHRLPPPLTTLINIIHSTGSSTSSRHLQLIDSITLHIPANILCAPDFAPQPFIPSHHLPSLKHWNTSISRTKTCPVPDLTLSSIRQLWHDNWQLMLNRPHPPQVCKPISFQYPPAFWKRFWKLPIPHKAVTLWWRLLHDSVGTRHKFHKWKIREVSSAECTICKAGNEDLFHMFVDCPFKRPFWIDALQFLNLTDVLPDKNSIWYALLSFRSQNQRPLDDSVLSRLGCIVAVLWRYHWRCVIDDEHWSHQAAFNLLTQDPLFSSFVPHDQSPSV